MDYERVDDQDQQQEQPYQSDSVAAEHDQQTIEETTQAAPVYRPFSQLELLTFAIERNPDAPVNYLLRGETYFTDGNDELAAQDFAKALALAEAQIDSTDWGYIYESYIDRAREGLSRCKI